MGIGEKERGQRRGTEYGIEGGEARSERKDSFCIVGFAYHMDA